MNCMQSNELSTWSEEDTVIDDPNKQNHGKIRQVFGAPNRISFYERLAASQLKKKTNQREIYRGLEEFESLRN